MSNGIKKIATSARKSVLTISLSQYLSGTPITGVIEAAWQKAGKSAEHVNNEGLNLDPTDSPQSLKKLQAVLQSKRWDGILFGWCIRGNAEYTQFFERVVNMSVEETRSTSAKMMFCTGPDNVLPAVLRNFPASK